MEKKQKKKNRNEMTCQMLSAAASIAALVVDNENETPAADYSEANKDRDIRLLLKKQ